MTARVRDSWSSWRAPHDEITVALRDLRTDLHTGLSDLATVSSPTVSGAGPDTRDCDPDDVAVTPFAAGAVHLGWGQSAHAVTVHVGSCPWQLPRDGDVVPHLRRIVEAAVAGRVEVGWCMSVPVGRLGAVRLTTCRVHLADGTVLTDARRRPLFRPAGPVEWAWAAPFVRRHDLLQRVVDVAWHLRSRAEAHDGSTGGPPSDRRADGQASAEPSR